MKRIIASLTITSILTFTAIKVVANYGPHNLWHPAGLAKGGTATYSVSIKPSSLEDYIVWSNLNDKITIVSSGKGSKVTIQAGNELGTSGLANSVMNLQYPTLFNIQILEPTTVNVVAYIVCKDNGSDAPITPAGIIEKIDETNNKLCYAAMTLNLVEIRYVSNTLWQTVDFANGRSRRMVDFNAVTNSSDGIKVFFVKTIGNRITGLTSSNSIAISPIANPITLAHEVGHACGLNDIYDYRRNGSTLILLPGPVAAARMNPLDWSAGLYPKNLQQAEFVQRFLMYGYTSDTKGCIPHGDVFGLNAQNTTALIKVGLNGMNREPKHTPLQHP